MSPLVKRVVSEFDQVELWEIEADENEDIMRSYDVRSLPTFILVNEEGRVIKTLVGQQKEDVFRSWLSSGVQENADISS